MIASDAAPGIPTFGKDVPHPRAYGTFACVLGVYVREKKVLTLEEAVRKMSAFPAQRLGAREPRSHPAWHEGRRGDFNPATVKDLATFEKPHQYAEGISAVVVNGQLALADGKMTGARAGRALKRNGQKLPTAEGVVGRPPREGARSRALRSSPSSARSAVRSPP